MNESLKDEYFLSFTLHNSGFQWKDAKGRNEIVDQFIVQHIFRRVKGAQWHNTSRRKTVNLSQLSKEGAILGVKTAPLYISLFSPEQRQWPSKLSGDSTRDFYDMSTLRWGQKERSLCSRQCHERRVVGERSDGTTSEAPDAPPRRYLTLQRVREKWPL